MVRAYIFVLLPAELPKARWNNSISWKSSNKSHQPISLSLNRRLVKVS